jgi:hypothetical protein
VFPKLAAIVFILGVVPGSLWLGGFLPPPDSREDIVPYESRTIGAEEEWRDHVSALCGWERQQGRAFKNAFRRASSPVDIEFQFNAALRLSDESFAIFNRLETPFEYRREVRTLRRLFWEERMGVKNARDAFKKRRRGAFLRGVRRFVAADVKSSRLLAELGVTGCDVKPVSIPESGRARIV